MAKETVTALVDGDVFVFRATLRAERPMTWDGDTFAPGANLDAAYAHFADFIDSVKARTGATDIVIALSHEQNFRRTILPSYKQNRRHRQSPLLRKTLKKLVLTKYRCFMQPQLEGDDILGILATGDAFIKGDKVIVSVDKDMKSIPCTYYSFDDRIIYTHNEEEADFNHLIQTLTGDTSDGYTGCPGIGPKKAAKILGKCRRGRGFDRAQAWEMVLHTFKNANYDKDYALTQARVARICRSTDYDFETKRPILWNP